MSTITTNTPSFPALTLGWREATHGRSFAEFNPTTLTSYCTECLEDITNNRDEQVWHVCASDAMHVDQSAMVLSRRMHGDSPELIRPSGARRGLPLVRWDDVAHWNTKGEATRAARMAGITKTATAIKATSPLAWGWVLAESAPDGQAILTERGLTAAVERCSAEHRTHTFESGHERRPHFKSNGTYRYRMEYSTGWVCTCGNGGFGDDRDRASAQRLAKAHREDPSGFPGQPWQSGTVRYEEA